MDSYLIFGDISIMTYFSNIQSVWLLIIKIDKETTNKY